VEVYESFFYRGGSTGFRVLIDGCTFHETWATSEGGAISDEASGAKTTITRCCFRSDRVTGGNGLGCALSFYNGVEQKNVTYSNFQNCSATISTGKGTIYVHSATQCFFDRLNITATVMLSTGDSTGLGAAICTGPLTTYSTPAACRWVLSYSTILRLSGASGIHSATAIQGTVSCCNFYENTMTSTDRKSVV
jgi:hypothetical protein